MFIYLALGFVNLRLLKQSCFFFSLKKKKVVIGKIFLNKYMCNLEMSFDGKKKHGK